VSVFPEDWPRLKEVFEGARQLPPGERPAYLTAMCSDNQALRQEVESLLASLDRAQLFLTTTAVFNAASLFY